MAVPTTIDSTRQIVAAGTDFFLESATLRASGFDSTLNTGASLHIYSGTNTNGVLICTLGCDREQSDHQYHINYASDAGIYARLYTGAGYAIGIMYQR